MKARIGSDRLQLQAVTYEEDICAGLLHMAQQAEHVARADEAGFVDDEHGASIEKGMAVLGRFEPTRRRA